MREEELLLYFTNTASALLGIPAFSKQSSTLLLQVSLDIGRVCSVFCQSDPTLWWTVDWQCAWLHWKTWSHCQSDAFHVHNSTWFGKIPETQPQTTSEPPPCSTGGCRHSLHTLATHLHSFEPEIVHSSLSWFSAQPLCNLAYLSLPLRPFLTRLHWSAGGSNTESHVSLRSCVRYLKTWLSDVHLLPIVSDLLSLLSSFLRLFLVHITLGHEAWSCYHWYSS